MEVQQSEDAAQWVEAINGWCARVLRPGTRLFLPAGGTPVPLYRSWERERPAFLRGVALCQIDEVLDGSERFAKFLAAELPHYRAQIHGLGDLQSSADFALLGLGLNGHVAFHEPSLPRHFTSGCVKLEAATCRGLGVAEGTWGASYGVGCFLRCREIALIVRGAGKREVLARVLRGDPALPASALIAHPGLQIFADTEAMPL